MIIQELKDDQKKGGISPEFLWYIFKPYGYVFGIIICINFIVTYLFSQPFLIDLIPGEYKLWGIALLNFGLCYAGGYLIKANRDENYAFALLQGESENKIEKNSFEYNYFSMATKGTYLFVSIISLNMFAAYAVNSIPFLKKLPDSYLVVGVYILDLVLGHMGILYIQKQNQIAQKNEKAQQALKLKKEKFKKALQDKIKAKEQSKSNPRVKPRRRIPLWDDNNAKNLFEPVPVTQQEILQQMQAQAQREEQARIKSLETKNRHESSIEAIRRKLKTSQHTEALMILKSYNLFVAQEQAAAIENRPLKGLCDFNLDEFMPHELPPSNQVQLKALSEMLRHRFNIAEMQVYGSYPVFLASLRLGVDLPKIRRPRDLDLRFEVQIEDTAEIAILIQDLFLIGFSLKEYPFPLTNLVKLKNYIFERKTARGYLNLFCLPSSEDAYEIEVTVIFKQYYRKNYNPFNLLRHYLKIQEDQVCFDGNNLRLRKQLALDILNEQFNIDVDALLNPHTYNAFNVFSRLLRNKKAWEPFYNMDSGNLNITLINLPLIIDFFRIRFDLHKQKECFLELVNIIIQNDFLISQTEFIIKGFLFALLEAINEESLLYIEKPIFNVNEAQQDVNEITQKLQNAFSTFIPTVQGSSEYNKKVFKKFYLSLIEILVHHKPEDDAQVFFYNAQQCQESILFNTYIKPRMKNSPFKLF